MKYYAERRKSIAQEKHGVSKPFFDKDEKVYSMKDEKAGVVGKSTMETSSKKVVYAVHFDDETVGTAYASQLRSVEK